MAYVTPATMADGAVISAARWNQDVVNNTIFLHSPPYVRLTKIIAQNFAVDTVSTVIFTTAINDNDGMADLDNNRIVIQTAGLYVFTGVVHMVDLTGSGEKYAQILHSSGDLIASLAADHSNTTTYHTVTGQRFCAVGESVTLQTYLSAGSNPTIESFSLLSAHWLRGSLS